ncbi:hypothetical protein B7C42_00049 [Nocardia cerradoensis]|uniref:Uncharacterized protein n=1 Tax=Nocardia cerradoensis TaxID=85688 RepID=A0A231HDA2_9NOCA|nr:hypothetical protein B7C42_00049 [Nocardia cerradoensis]
MIIDPVDPIQHLIGAIAWLLIRGQLHGPDTCLEHESSVEFRYENRTWRPTFDPARPAVYPTHPQHRYSARHVPCSNRWPRAPARGAS